MASSHCSIALLCLLVFCFISANSVSSSSHYSDEQESVYQVLEAINSGIDWRSLFPDDFCDSAPHGIVCEYFFDDNGTISTPHITELNFGYVSDFSPNPPCSFNSTLSPRLSSFTYLRKLFFYQCFTATMVSFPGFLSTLGSTLEELVFIDNPSLVGTLSGNLGNLTALRRFILSGSSVSGEIPDEIGGLLELEEVTISRNPFHGVVPQSLGNLKKLKVLDLSYNGLKGNLPDSIGKMTELVKLDLGSNRFDGGIPESLVGLQELEFLDLSYNHFGNFGIPPFLAEMPRLREVYLSGNPLGGQIPEIWEKLGGILRLGLSGLGLDGKIPASMGVSLRNICFLGLDHNNLEGTVPEEFGFLESVLEMNLENNRLTGRLPFSAKFSARIGKKLKLAGNPNLCIDGEAQENGSLGYLKFCNKPSKPDAVLFSSSESSSPVQSSLLLIIFLGLFLTFCL
ncbi:piriformospora indica-insensitive protein 2-like [Macadamia integrifolia]|uniref:piriformospora indica-insensitive protein 2-like n=1 Tax=Macadamia integrifolia TaxID=60698 RepID=UPI001C4FCC68|nr:piriformospora indica-insensitive protein 2-like [Macadamia integrifolia]